MTIPRRLAANLIGVFFCANLAIILYFWWLGSRTFILGDAGRQLIAYGRLSGLLLVLLVMLQLILIGRTGWVERIFGLDKLSRLHHLIGIGLVTLLAAHPLLLIFGYAARTGNDWWNQFLDFQNWQNVLAATVAAGLFFVVVLASAMVVGKKLKYETWYFIHLIAYLAILLAFGHQLAVGRDLQDKNFVAYWYGLYAFVLLNFLYYRVFLLWRNYVRHDFKVEKVITETSDVVSIYISAKNLQRFKYQAGQFLIVRFLAKSLWWQAHPFSLSSAPGENYLRLTIKRLGDFTGALWDLKPGTKIIVDGPHGVFTARQAQRDKLLFIAGGIGITPILSLFSNLAPTQKNCTVLYANRDFKTTALQNELNALAAKNDCRIHYIMSHDQDWSGESGYMDREKIMRLVPDLKEREVFLCGPAPMMQSVLKILSSEGVPKNRIHYEKFSL